MTSAEALAKAHDCGDTVAIRHVIRHTSGPRSTFSELLALICARVSW